MAANLELIIKAKDEASTVLKKVDDSAGGLSKSLGTGLKVAGAAAAVGIGAAVFAGIDFVKAAADEQKGIAMLSAAVNANGGDWSKNKDEIEKVIATREKLAFSDDQQRESIAFLTAQTGDYREALNRNRLAMDLSRGANIDLFTASRLLGKVSDENTSALGRLGIQVGKNATAQDVLAAVQKKFGGQAEAYAGTATAKWERFNQALDNIKETLGGVLLPIVTEVGEAIAGFLEDHQQDIDDMVESFQEWAHSDLFPAIRDFANTLKDDLLPPLKDVGSVLKDDVLPVVGDFLEKVDGFVGKKAETAAAVAAVAVAFVGLALAAGSAAVSIGLALLPVIAITAAAALLVGGLVVLDEKTGLVSDAFDTASTAASGLWDWLGPHLQDSATELSRLYNNVLAPAAAGIADWFSNHVSPALEDVWNWMKDHETEIAILAGVILTLVAPWAAVGLAASGAILLISSNLTGVILKVAEGINTLSGYINQFVDAYNSIADTEIFGVRLGPHLERQKLIDIDQLRSKLVGGGDITPGYSVHGQSYAMGTRYVPYDMIAQIHRGEAIIPASENTGSWGGMTLVYSPTYSNATPAEAERFALWVKQAMRA